VLVGHLCAEENVRVEWAESEYSQETTMRLARSGAWVRIVTEEDACDVCKAMAQHVFTPSEVPRLPIAGCEKDTCRCRFEAVDPQTEMSVSELVDLGIHELKIGRPQQARDILRRAVTLDEECEKGWLWLSAVVDDQEKLACLETVLSINPANVHARAGIEALGQKGQAVATTPEVTAQDPEIEPDPVLTSDPSETELTERAGSISEEMLDTILALRDERQVIVEQWIEFMGLADQVDSDVLQVQAEAFIERLQDANAQTLSLLSEWDVPPESRLEELYLEWQESEEMGEALAEVIEAHRSRDREAPNWQPMRNALARLGHELITHRNHLRERIAAAGGTVPE
jgi:hypothetical protein